MFTYDRAMSQTILAIYENGVLVPLESLSLSDRTQVRLTVETAPFAEDVSSNLPENGDPLDGIRVATGVPDLAQNFNDYRFGTKSP